VRRTSISDDHLSFTPEQQRHIQDIPSISGHSKCTTHIHLRASSPIWSAGLLRRISDPAHGRILRAELTKCSQNLLRQAHKAATEVAMTASMRAEDAALLGTLLARCINDLTSAKKGRK
jgi:DNA-binding MarR family transcriptional regulator